MNLRRRRTAFTLIELLVVIAIIALLVGILLPSLGKAKKAGWKAVSMSNLRQIMLGCEQYRMDNDDNVGYPPCRVDRGSVRAICTWTYGGKDTHEEWESGGNAPFDVSGAGRPINKYVYPKAEFPEPYNYNWSDPENYRIGKPPREGGRQTIELPVFRDPSDQISYQWNWPSENQKGLSSYDDVGTSYHTNLRWFDALREDGFGFSDAFWEGMRRLRLAADFNPSTFVYIHDQTADIATQIDSRATSRYPEGIINGYGDRNKSVMAFYDAHVDYIQCELRKANTYEYQLHMVMPGDDRNDGGN